MDSSRELASIYAIGFIISLYLLLLIGVQTSDVTGLKFSPWETNRPLILLQCPKHVFWSLVTVVKSCVVFAVGLPTNWLVYDIYVYNWKLFGFERYNFSRSPVS
jgi:uncharacterized integral membrane protein